MLTLFFFGLRLTPELWVDVPKPKAESIEWRVSMSFAYTSLLFLSVALAVGPYYVLSNRPISINILLRRDIAIWAGIWAIAHSSIALFIHVEGLKFWNSFVYQLPSLANPLPLKLNRIGQANYIGLFQLLIIVLLLFLSNNVALRKLGSKHWKNLQRLSYVAMGSIMLHAFIYHRVEQRLWSFRWPVYGIFAVVVVLQLAGFYYYRRRKKQRTVSKGQELL